MSEDFGYNAHRKDQAMLTPDQLQVFRWRESQLWEQAMTKTTFWLDETLALDQLRWELGAYGLDLLGYDLAKEWAEGRYVDPWPPVWTDWKGGKRTGEGGEPEGVQESEPHV
jgi:hypothetical protein